MEFLDVVSEERRTEQRLACVHPVDIATQRVDLAVVRYIAVGMSPLPTWKGVRGKPLVHKAQRAHNIGIGQFAIEVRDLLREQEPFVDDRPAGERWNVKHLRVFDPGFANFAFGTLANDV